MEVKIWNNVRDGGIWEGDTQLIRKLKMMGPIWSVIAIRIGVALRKAVGRTDCDGGKDAERD